MTKSMSTVSNLLEKHFSDDYDRKLRLDEFLKKGFPTKADEEFKYSDISKFLDKNFTNLSIHTSDIGAEEITHRIGNEGNHIVFINGEFNEDLSKIQSKANLEIVPFNPNQSYGRFYQLATALSKTLDTIKINGECEPIHVHHFLDRNNGNGLINTFLSFDVALNSKVEVLINNYSIGSSSTLLNSQIDVQVGKNSSFNLTKIQDNDSNLYEINGLSVNQDRDSRFYTNTFTFSGPFIRNDIRISQNDENCESYMDGLYLIDGKSHVDNHTVVDHTKPNSYSQELYKGIVDGRATAIFNGKIFVRPDAQKTNAFQSNNNISLSDDATIHTKPQLEIWADDVKCSHGCTVGQLDEEALYYLKSRGINKYTAKAMMLIAFAEESFGHVPFEVVKDQLHTKIQQRLIP